MRTYHFVFLASLVCLKPGYASTTLVDFDHITPSEVVNHVKGLPGYTWTNFGVIAASYANGPKGLVEGVASTPNVAFNSDPGLPSTIAGPKFGLVDGWFSSWEENPIQITVTGWRASDNMAYRAEFTADSLGPMIYLFDWQGLDLLTMEAVSSSGAARFSLDDLRLTIQIDEPRIAFVFAFGLALLSVRPLRRVRNFG